MIEKHYHFITGLPRSGSTLLSSILSQNPKFSASISDALSSCVCGALDSLNGIDGSNELISENIKKNIIKGIFENYYSENNASTIFNTSREWTYLTPLISDLFPESKYIVCVRDINWILDSFEQAQRKNPYNRTSYAGSITGSVYDRISSLMKDNGIVMNPYNGIKQAIVSNEKHKLFFIEYENLTKQPEYVMKLLYSFLEEDYFEHDFNNVEKSFDDYDSHIGVKLHTVRKQVEFIERDFILPPEILNEYQNMEFWRGYFSE
jgi:sulfotransferase